MTNIITNKIKQSAGDLARKAAKAAREEKEGFLRTAKVAAVGEQKPTSSGISVIDQIITGNGTVKEVKSEEEQKLLQEQRKRITALEDELNAIRQQRVQKDQNWSEEQDKLLHKDDAGADQAPIPMPKSRKSQGMKNPGQKQKGGGFEMVRQKK